MNRFSIPRDQGWRGERHTAIRTIIGSTRQHFILDDRMTSFIGLNARLGSAIDGLSNALEVRAAR